MGWVDLIEYSLYALLAGALWRTFSRRRVNSSRVYARVCKPDNNPIHLIERK